MTSPKSSHVMSIYCRSFDSVSFQDFLGVPFFPFSGNHVSACFGDSIVTILWTFAAVWSTSV